MCLNLIVFNYWKRPIVKKYWQTHKNGFIGFSPVLLIGSIF